MVSKLKNGTKVVGLRQTKKAVAANKTLCAFLASDADPDATGAIAVLCQERDTPVEWVPSMKELGLSCGITVGAAAAALLKE